MADILVPTTVAGASVGTQQAVTQRLRDNADGTYSPVNYVNAKPFGDVAFDWTFVPATGGIVNSTVAVTIKAAAGATSRNYITGLHIAASALGAATEVVIRDGAAGTVLFRTFVATGGLMGNNITFATPLRGSLNTLLEVATLTASVTGGVYVNAQGYTGV